MEKKKKTGVRKKTVKSLKSLAGYKIIIKQYKVNYIYQSMLEQVKARNLRVGGLQQRFYGSGRFQRSCDIFKVLKIAAL